MNILSVLILFSVSFSNTFGFSSLDFDELSNLQYGIDILDKPLFFDESIDNNNAAIVLMSKYGQRYRCIFESATRINEKKKVEEAEAAKISIREMLKPLSDLPCLTLATGWWTYEFCYMKEIKQYHTTDGKIDSDILSLGLYSDEFDWTYNASKELTEVSGRYHSQRYKNGSVCNLTGSLRSSEIRFTCKENSPSILERVDEPTTCSYLLHVSTNLTCAHPNLKLVKKKQTLPIICNPVLGKEDYEEYLQLQPKEDTVEGEDIVIGGSDKSTSAGTTGEIPINSGQADSAAGTKNARDKTDYHWVDSSGTIGRYTVDLNTDRIAGSIFDNEGMILEGMVEGRADGRIDNDPSYEMERAERGEYHSDIEYRSTTAETETNSNNNDHHRQPDMKERNKIDDVYKSQFQKKASEKNDNNLGQSSSPPPVESEDLGRGKEIIIDQSQQRGDIRVNFAEEAKVIVEEKMGKSMDQISEVIFWNSGTDGIDKDSKVQREIGMVEKMDKRMIINTDEKNSVNDLNGQDGGEEMLPDDDRLLRGASGISSDGGDSKSGNVSRDDPEVGIFDEETGSIQDKGVNTGDITDKGVDTGSIPNQDLDTGSIPDNGVNTGSIPEKDVNTGKIPDKDLETGKILDKVVDTGKIPDKDVNTGSIPDKDVNTEEIPDKDVNTGSISDKVVDTGKIPDEVVDTGKIPDKDFNTGSIPDKDLETGKIPDKNVNTGLIPDKDVNNGEIPDKDVETRKIPDKVVDTGKISDKVVDNGKIPDKNVNTGLIPNKVVDTGSIPDKSGENTDFSGNDDDGADGGIFADGKTFNDLKNEVDMEIDKLGEDLEFNAVNIVKMEAIFAKLKKIREQLLKREKLNERHDEKKEVNQDSITEDDGSMFKKMETENTDGPPGTNDREIKQSTISWEGMAGVEGGGEEGANPVHQQQQQQQIRLGEGLRFDIRQLIKDGLKMMSAGDQIKNNKGSKIFKIKDGRVLENKDEDGVDDVVVEDGDTDGKEKSGSNDASDKTNAAENLDGEDYNNREDQIEIRVFSINMNSNVDGGLLLDNNKNFHTMIVAKIHRNDRDLKEIAKQKRIEANYKFNWKKEKEERVRKGQKNI